MTGEKIRIWEVGEYSYPGAYGFVPFMVSYIHDDDEIRPGMLIAPGGAYRYASPSEAHLPAMQFYRGGYNVFVLAYTVNYLNKPLKLQPLHDIARAVRIVRKNCKKYHIDPQKLTMCGFSAGGHLCASLCVHHKDIHDPDAAYDEVAVRPNAALLCYPVITSGEYANQESFRALLGENPDPEELEYMSLEKHVNGDVPPCFIWQTVTDASVPVENSYLFAGACKEAGVPYAHHVFSRGRHGMSVATEEWLERDFGQPYTLEQIRLLAEAVRAGKTSLPSEAAEEILREHELDGSKKEKWSAAEKEQIRNDMYEVTNWRELAKRWLARTLDLSTL